MQPDYSYSRIYVQMTPRQPNITDSHTDEEFYCPSCGYDLRGIPEDRCPECGYGYQHEAIRRLAVGQLAQNINTTHDFVLSSAVGVCCLLLTQPHNVLLFLGGGMFVRGMWCALFLIVEVALSLYAWSRGLSILEWIGSPYMVLILITTPIVCILGLISHAIPV